MWSVAFAVPRLNFEVVLSVWVEGSDLCRGLVSDHPLHHPLPVLLSLVHGVEDDVAVYPAVGPPGREPGEGYGARVGGVSDNVEVPGWGGGGGLLGRVEDN